MNATIELLNKALAKRRPAEWARMYDISQAVFNHAKNNGRLSPMLAGNLAMDLGEDPKHWMIVAAMETERESQLRTRLRQALMRTKV